MRITKEPEERKQEILMSLSDCLAKKATKNDDYGYRKGNRSSPGIVLSLLPIQRSIV